MTAATLNVTDEEEWLALAIEASKVRVWYGPKGKQKAHADSYRPDLPLWSEGITDGQLVKPTKEDKAYYASHPLTLWEHFKTCCLPSETCKVCNSKRGKDGKSITKARGMFAELNITDDVAAQGKAFVTKLRSDVAALGCLAG